MCMDPWRNVKLMPHENGYYPLSYTIGSRLNKVEIRMLNERATSKPKKSRPRTKPNHKLNQNARGFERVAQNIKKVGETFKEISDTVQTT